MHVRTPPEMGWVTSSLPNSGGVNEGETVSDAPPSGSLCPPYMPHLTSKEQPKPLHFATLIHRLFQMCVICWSEVSHGRIGLLLSPPHLSQVR